MASPSPAGAPRAKNWFLWLTGFVIVLAALGAAYTWLVLNWNYSSGERAGYVQKFSQKGWLCKTWEGELQISNIPGSAPVLFYFTVRSDSVARAIQGAEGRQVALSFEQHPGIPLSCFGDTEYFISGVRVVNPQPGLPGATPTPTPTSTPPADSVPSGAIPVPPPQK